jgi:hypothetical protein
MKSDTKQKRPKSGLAIEHQRFLRTVSMTEVFLNVQSDTHWLTQEIPGIQYLGDTMRQYKQDDICCFFPSPERKETS